MKFADQVLPTVKKVVYGVDIKRVFKGKLILGIADGWLEADGKRIYDVKDMRVGLFSPRPPASRRSGLAATDDHGDEAMRRVVVTGMGIVSSIGTNTQEVTASLHAGRSGITRAEKFAELGFRSQVQGAPTLNAEEVVDRRAMRFHGGGTAWNHVAMDQAIVDSGLAPGEVSNERTGLIMGSGGPSTRTIVEAADITRPKGPKRVGPFAVPKSMSLDRLGDACRPGSRSRASAIRSRRPARPRTIASAPPTSTS